MLKLPLGLQIHLLQELLADAEKMQDTESIRMLSHLIQKLTREP